MSVYVMNLVWYNSAITDRTEKLLLLALADWSTDDGSCWPFIAQLCRKCNITENSWQKHKRDFIDRGWLSMDLKAGPARNVRVDRRPNFYQLNIELLLKTYRGPRHDPPADDPSSDDPSSDDPSSDDPSSDDPPNVRRDVRHYINVTNNTSEQIQSSASALPSVSNEKGSNGSFLELKVETNDTRLGIPDQGLVRNYAAQIGLTDTDADQILDSWRASGFRLKDGTKIRDWKAVMRTWQRHGYFLSQKKVSRGNKEEVETFFREKLKLPQRDAVWFFTEMVASGWKYRGEAVSSWKALAIHWKQQDKVYPSQKAGFK